jgi:hypothetical protein
MLAIRLLANLSGEKATATRGLVFDQGLKSRVIHAVTVNAYGYSVNPNLQSVVLSRNSPLVDVL